MTTRSHAQHVDHNWLGRPATHWLCYAAVVLASAVVTVGIRPGTVRVDSSSLMVGKVGQATSGVNPNVAGWRELAALPGLGETLSKRIVAYRQAQRASRGDPDASVFRSLEDLQAVKGIGPKRAAALSKLVFFSD